MRQINNLRGLDQYPAKVAYILYWDHKHRVISETTMYAETVYPLTLLDAIQVFAPNGAVGANVDFKLMDGNFSNTLVIEHIREYKLKV